MHLMELKLITWRGKQPTQKDIITTISIDLVTNGINKHNLTGIQLKIYDKRNLKIRFSYQCSYEVTFSWNVYNHRHAEFKNIACNNNFVYFIITCYLGRIISV